MAGPQGITAACGLLLALLLLSGHQGSCFSVGPEPQRIIGMGRSGSTSSSMTHTVNQNNMGLGSHHDMSSRSNNRHLTLYGIEVPVYKFRGEDAQLECQYNGGTDPLYSVKWYKDDREFYRYLFKKPKPKTTFTTPGVNVNIRHSNERRVLLEKLSFNSTGVYKCEVSADSPHFRTYENQSVMVVVELPERGPTINGARTHYRIGDTARLNCTSAKSKPVAHLTWYINGEKVTEAPHLIEYYPWVHHDGLESRRLGLSFKVDESHFLKGELVLKCQATVAAIYTATKEEDAKVEDSEPVILEQRERLILVRNGVSMVLPTSSVTIMLAILIGSPAVT